MTTTTFDTCLTIQFYPVLGLLPKQ